MSSLTTDPPPRFRPLPLLANPHFQTVAGFFWRGRPFRHPTRAAVLQLSDGDRLVMHDSVPPGWHEAAPIALLIHGMGGDSRSGYVQRMADRLYRRGVRVVRVDMRGTGAGFGMAVGFYHVGRSSDIREVVGELHRWAPRAPIWVVGFSLGGNVALKFAGEAAADPAPGLARAVAVSAPIDVPTCSELISRRRNWVYDRFFARKFVALARIRQRYYPEPPLPRFPSWLGVRDFDELFTAPRCGFPNAREFYRHASSYPLIPRIAVPTLLTTARDDPFVAVAPYESLRVPPHVRVEIHEHGGHLGFLGDDGAGGVRWLERRIERWLMDEPVQQPAGAPE